MKISASVFGILQIRELSSGLCIALPLSLTPGYSPALLRSGLVLGLPYKLRISEGGSQDFLTMPNWACQVLGSIRRQALNYLSIRLQPFADAGSVLRSARLSNQFKGLIIVCDAFSQVTNSESPGGATRARSHRARSSRHHCASAAGVCEAVLWFRVYGERASDSCDAGTGARCRACRCPEYFVQSVPSTS